jgi:hypothetical protein
VRGGAASIVNPYTRRVSDDFSGIDRGSGYLAHFFGTSTWRTVLMISALGLCLGATWFAAYGWNRQLPSVPECDSHAYQPFIDSLRRSEDALKTALALSMGALVVAIGGLTQAVGVFKRGIFRWVLTLTFVIIALPIEITLLVLKQLQAPNCF